MVESNCDYKSTAPARTKTMEAAKRPAAPSKPLLRISWEAAMAALDMPDAVADGPALSGRVVMRSRLTVDRLSDDDDEVMVLLAFVELMVDVMLAGIVVAVPLMTVTMLGPAGPMLRERGDRGVV